MGTTLHKVGWDWIGWSSGGIWYRAPYGAKKSFLILGEKSSSPYILESLEQSLAIIQPRQVAVLQKNLCSKLDLPWRVFLPPIKSHTHTGVQTCDLVECTEYGTVNSWSLGCFYFCHESWRDFLTPKVAHSVQTYDEIKCAYRICWSILWNFMFLFMEFATP